jgi:hypothetical protein
MQPGLVQQRVVNTHGYVQLRMTQGFCEWSFAKKTRRECFAHGEISRLFFFLGQEGFDEMTAGRKQSWFTFLFGSRMVVVTLFCVQPRKITIIWVHCSSFRRFSGHLTQNIS